MISRIISTLHPKSSMTLRSASVHCCLVNVCFYAAVVVMVNLKFCRVAMTNIKTDALSIWMQPIAFRLINQQSMR